MAHEHFELPKMKIDKLWRIQHGFRYTRTIELMKKHPYTDAIFQDPTLLRWYSKRCVA